MEYQTVSPDNLSPPYTGTGFTGNSNGRLIPEYYNNTTKYDTADLYIVDDYGNKTHYATFVVFAIPIIIETNVYSANIVAFRNCKKRSINSSIVFMVIAYVINVPITLIILCIYILALISI
jgi:hypothetical protein